ncbi:MAG: hypothetical protein JO360_11670 [Acidobacteria bacterium]|nr:hypothetical protein [Acidobacteriota bacterium]
MANDNQIKSTLDDKPKDGGLETPDAPNAVEEVANDERAQDFGESGQFAPGGYYNQQNVLAPDRIDLDEGTKTGGSEGDK